MAGSARNHERIVWAILALIFATFSILIAQTAQAQTVSTNSYLIGFQPDATPAERQAVLDALDVEVVRWLPQANVAQVMLRQSDGVFASSALGATMPFLTYIEQDSVVTGDLTPNDPAFSSPTQSYGQQIVQAPRGWNLSRGITETIIAVLDSGITPDHAEFVGRVLPGYDFINDDDDPLDDHGHGTHVAGI
ncbi:MAG: S8 family serine peptidase, partial [Caldilinea sp.]